MLHEHLDPTNQLLSYLQKANDRIGALDAKNERLEQDARDNQRKIIILEERQNRLQRDLDKSNKYINELDGKIEDLEKKATIASGVVAIAVFVASTIGGNILENWVNGYLEPSSAIQYSILD
ncbi:MAG: hypothetical protein AAGA60_10895 [Cyanobacteria bacterium P01_E01_bin.42]